MTARADEAERRLTAIELRLEGIDSLIADVRRWLLDSLRTGERERPLTPPEAEARDRLLNAAEHSPPPLPGTRSFRHRKATTRASSWPH